jgi:hypothetical protein
MDYRCQNDELFLIPKVVDGKLCDSNTKKYKVKSLKQISGTKFPDYDEIVFEKENIIRPAEIKFITSKFNYHKDPKYKSDYLKFINQKGFIICVKHDELPQGIDLSSKIDIFQIDYFNFIEYCKENFSLLFSRQIDLHVHKNIWLMYASSNFYDEINNIKPAVITKRWAPSQNLGNLEIGIGDIILLFKCKGINRITSQKYFLENKRTPHPELVISNLNILKVTSNIFSREEYCIKNKFDFNDYLWPDEIKNGPKWKRIFDFDIIKKIEQPISLSDLYKSSEKSKIISTFFCEVFQSPNLGRKIEEEDYVNLLEYLI